MSIILANIRSLRAMCPTFAIQTTTLQSTNLHFEPSSGFRSRILSAAEIRPDWLCHFDLTATFSNSVNSIKDF